MQKKVVAVGKQTNSNFTVKPIATSIEFYLTGVLGQPEDYVEWFDLIRHASPNDVVKIYINSPGGDVFTAIQFMRVINECSAPVFMSVEGQCLSAATMIFLSGDSYEITDHSAFMFHNYSGGVLGKGGEIFSQVQHDRKWSTRLLESVYKNFLTPEELKKILEGVDLWMDGAEVAKRLKSRNEKFEKRGKRNAPTRPKESETE